MYIYIRVFGKAEVFLYAVPIYCNLGLSLTIRELIWFFTYSSVADTDPWDLGLISHSDPDPSIKHQSKSYISLLKKCNMAKFYSIIIWSFKEKSRINLERNKNYKKIWIFRFLVRSKQDPDQEFWKPDPGSDAKLSGSTTSCFIVIFYWFLIWIILIKNSSYHLKLKCLLLTGVSS